MQPIEPATPLPWRLVVENGCSIDNVTRVYGGDLNDFNYVVMDNEQYYPHAVDPRDADYAVHTANAYPRLTERVRVLEEAICDALAWIDQHCLAECDEGCECDICKVRDALAWFEPNNAALADGGEVGK